MSPAIQRQALRLVSCPGGVRVERAENAGGGRVDDEALILKVCHVDGPSRVDRHTEGMVEAGDGSADRIVRGEDLDHDVRLEIRHPQHAVLDGHADGLRESAAAGVLRYECTGSAVEGHHSLVPCVSDIQYSDLVDRDVLMAAAENNTKAARERERGSEHVHRGGAGRQAGEAHCSSLCRVCACACAELTTGPARPRPPKVCTIVPVVFIW